MTAMAVHWRAFQETTFGSRYGRPGPAMDLMNELFTRRVHRVFGGSYDVKALIREPAGWVALNDKLMLI